MSNTAALLDKVKVKRSLPSDMALAARIGVSRSIVSEWRKGSKFPSEDHVCALAQMAGEDAGQWLVLTQADKTTGPAHRAWVDLARKFGAAAALAVVALLPQGNAQASAQVSLNDSPHYALCEKVRRGLRRLAAAVGPFRPAFAA